jgi:hypothetical protein
LPIGGFEVGTFVPVKSEEELLSAVRAGLLWYNGDSEMPRAIRGWFNETDEEWALRVYRRACAAAALAKMMGRHVDTLRAIPEDFAVLVEDE